MIDFRAIAKERAGKLWERADETKRQKLVAFEKVEWMRAQLGEPEPDKGYAAWLKRQPVAVQDAALGKVRAKLWREGGITLERFISPAGKPLTLKELAAIAPQAFERAGIDPAKER